jgi:hypothetical protein
MISTVLWLLNDLLFLKTDVNVPLVRNKQQNLNVTEGKNRFRIRNPMVQVRDPDPGHWRLLLYI